MAKRQRFYRSPFFWRAILDGVERGLRERADSRMRKLDEEHQRQRSRIEAKMGLLQLAATQMRWALTGWENKQGGREEAEKKEHAA